MISTKKDPALEQAGPGKLSQSTTQSASASAKASAGQSSPLDSGCLDPVHFDLLMSFTNIRGEKLLKALRGYFVEFIQQKDLVTTFEVNQSLLSRKTKEIYEVDGQIRQHVAACKIAALEPGKVDSAHFDFLMSRTNIRGEKILAALRGYFVDGAPQKNLVATLGINQSLLSRKTGDIHEVNERLVQISKYYR